MSETAVLDPREQIFYEAWKDAIGLLEPRFRRYFLKREPRYYSVEGPSKWDLAPDTDRLIRESGVYSTGERLYLACLLSFYNGDDGQDALQGVGYPNFVRALVRLGERERKAIFRLLDCFPGW